MIPKYEISRREYRKDAMLKATVWTSWFLVPVVPAAIIFGAGLLFVFSPPAMATLVFLSLLWLFIGGVLGLGVTAGVALYRAKWHGDVRERLARRGIMAHEIEWFRSELTGSEKRALAEISKVSDALADAYRDTLAARLTSKRILRSARAEQQLVKRRQNKVRQLRSENSSMLMAELDQDLQKLVELEQNSKAMLDEAETRLQMIEAAFRRGSVVADAELATKTLSTRTSELPIALEAARMEDEIRRELEKEV